MKQIIVNSKKWGSKIAYVDDLDYDQLIEYNWTVRESDGYFYAVRRERKTGRIIRMHRQILDVKDSSLFVDHKDHDGLNNQRDNIRVATIRQNNCNVLPLKNASSKYLGVSVCNRAKRFQVQICKDRKRISLGRYYTEEEAALAYNEAAKVIHGEFANLNSVSKELLKIRGK